MYLTQFNSKEFEQAVNYNEDLANIIAQKRIGIQILQLTYLLSFCKQVVVLLPFPLPLNF